MHILSPSGNPAGAIRLQGQDFFGWALFSHVATAGTPAGATISVRCALGERLFRYRYQGEREHLETIVETFLSAIDACFPGKRATFDCLILPSPPLSRPDYGRIVELATGLSRATGIFSAQFAVRRSAGAPPSFAFASAQASGLFRGKNVLVIDDLYRSGKTLHALCRFLKREGGASAVSVLVGSAMATAASRSSR